ncbi:ABC transporter ATP-binding protein [Bacillus sp. FJAT-45350]|uniref:ABC transporter ATP-binding protein n=1 Tax=Bacillus sp. FJAT-45350 TaxID=2011014 RepID=UPI000BB90F5A|nr:ABC transporter ATP-binding protein [Bacillus sp. FJAT-45350]
MIQFKNVNLTYQNMNIPTLDNINLQIRLGEWVSLVGPSGSGKTSLLKLISGSIEPTNGSILLNQMNFSDLSMDRKHDFIRENVATIYQQFRLLPQFSVIENIMLPLVPYEKRKKIEEKALELIKEVGLSHRIEHFPNQLSGGEQQRVAIARALITEPKILLCDEPTGNLDTNNRDIILELLRQISKKGHTIVLATHDEIVAKEGDSVISIIEGVLHHDTL